MLPQNFQRKDAKSQSRKGQGRPTSFASLCLCVFALSIFNSCGSKPTDLRTLIPADSLVYLESNDLGAVMKTITDRPAFREAAKTVPDFSALNGVRLAVAVTGFETKEQPVTDENSVLNFQPRFVAVLETNAWNFQAKSFAENQLNDLVNRAFDGDGKLGHYEKYGGTYLTWAASDGRKAYALILGSLIFFGNDESAIEKSLAVKRGEADSIAKNPKITNGDRLAFGYVSLDGVAQIANVLGVKYASEASDEPEVQSAVAGILPKLLRSTVMDVTWVAKRSERGIEDQWEVSLRPEISNVLNETMRTADGRREASLDQVNSTAKFVTIYDLRDPQIAWRSIVLTAQKFFDPVTAKFISISANSLFESYGISDPETFLSMVESPIIVVRGEDEQQVAVAASIKDSEKMRSLITAKKPVVLTHPDYVGVQMFKSDDDDLTTSFSRDWVATGTSGIVEKLLEDDPDGGFRSTENGKLLAGKKGAAVSFGTDSRSCSAILELLSVNSESISNIETHYLTTTSFNKTGIDRRTSSDFGFIGWIITQFAKED